jgi:carbonic anhydrase
MSETLDINAAQAAGEPAELTDVAEPSKPSAPRLRLPTLLLAAIISVPLLIGGGLGGMLLARSTSPGDMAQTEAQWSYQGAQGPAHWGETNPKDLLCQTGGDQSPIDIRGQRILRIPWLDPLQLSYKPSKIRLQHTDHAFHVSYDPGSVMTLNGNRYALTQSTFHTPSEHWIDGSPAPMEMQLTHISPDLPGSRVILSILFAEGPENPFLSRFWHQIPEKAGSEVPTEITVNAMDVLPRDLRYFYYDGSLTTPPCTEGVKWIVLKHPVTASRAQIDRHRSVFGQNARPPQPVRERWIREGLLPGER